MSTRPFSSPSPPPPAASPSANSSGSNNDGWEKYPVYLSPANSKTFHLVKFITQLPTVPQPPGTAAAAAAAASAAPGAAKGASPASASSAPPPPPPPKLLYPFTSGTRLCSPKHVDVRGPFLQRKKVMRTQASGGGAAGGGGTDEKSASASSSASASGGTGTELDLEGINPLDRKWRLEDSRAPRGAPSYFGSREVHARKVSQREITPNHHILLRRGANEPKFTVVPVVNYNFRHEYVSEGIMSLEEAERQMKTRMKRFEKRVRNMATLAAHQDEEDGGADGLGGGSGGGGGGGGAGGGLLERARPSLGGKIQPPPKEDKADDAFSDLTSLSTSRLSAGARKAAALAKAAKVKREGGADYTRHFDDDDVTFEGEDMLDGQGAEADLDQDFGDELEQLEAERWDTQADLEAMERKNQVLLKHKKGDMSLEEAEEAAQQEEEEEERIPSDLDEDEEGTPSKTASSGTNKPGGVKKESASSDEDDGRDEYEDDDLSLDDESDEEEVKKMEDKKPDVKKIIKNEPGATTTTPAAAAAPANMRKRPISPAVNTAATKKVKVEGGAAATPAAAGAPAGGAAAAASASAALTPAELAELERIIIHELQSAPPTSPYTSKSLALHLNKTYPKLFNRRTVEALRRVLMKLVVVQADKTHIILRKEYQKQTTQTQAQPMQQ